MKDPTRAYGPTFAIVILTCIVLYVGFLGLQEIRDNIQRANSVQISEDILLPTIDDESIIREDIRVLGEFEGYLTDEQIKVLIQQIKTQDEIFQKEVDALAEEI